MKKKIIYPNNTLTRKMNRQGWETVEQFYHNSSVNQVVSRETCRQLILHQKKVVEPIFIKIAEALGFTPNEIKDVLHEYGYTDFVHLIGDHHGLKLTDEEETFLSLFRKLRRSRPAVVTSLLNIFDSLCCVAEIDCSEEISRLNKRQ
ncbi:MAG: hypothetical protein C4581_00180 [Nitrospiraceae bacterium]|nr:MAG: hypothetical protein C4581_00180 [Nitrospiraceae bacterium]